MAQRKIHAFFSRRQQEQPIHDCGEVMAISEISSSVPKEASINNDEYFIASTSGESTNVNEPSTRSSACTCSCCENFEVAHHPTNLSQSKSSNSSRCIQTSWYSRYPWITVCTSSYKVFCHVCCLAKEQGLVTSAFPKHSMTSSPFLEGGFCNWKKALQKFYQHERSELHSESSLKLAAKASTPDIVSQLRLQHDKELQTNRAMFLKVLECVTFLARQGLDLRGHREDSESF